MIHEAIPIWNNLTDLVARIPQCWLVLMPGKYRLRPRGKSIRNYSVMILQICAIAMWRQSRNCGWAFAPRPAICGRRPFVGEQIAVVGLLSLCIRMADTMASRILPDLWSLTGRR